MNNLIIWLSMAALMGIIEAILFHFCPKLNRNFEYQFGFDIHYFFTFLRGIVLYLLVMSTEHEIVFFLVAACVFPFIHDGFYYQARKYLSRGKIYPVGFWDQSTTTSAKISFSVFWRIVLFIFGIGMSFVLIY